MINPLRFYLSIALALVVGIAIVVFIGRYREGRKAVAQSEQRGEILITTSAGVQDSADIDAAQADRTAGLTAAREQFRQSKQEAIHNEPETADRADRRVPDSVRTAFRERRLARQRLGCAGGQCREDDATDAATQR